MSLLGMPTPKDKKWMKVCVDSAQLFSTCAKRQYFAVVLNSHGHVLSTGYNGGPAGMVHCKDGGCPRNIEQSAPRSSYDNCIAIHAEANALLHSDYTARIDGGTIYVNGPPCYSCAKLVANSGLNRVVYLKEEGAYMDWASVRSLFDQTNIELVAINACK